MVFSVKIWGPEQWIGLAEAIGKEIEKGVQGIVIGHGTDTMHHTAAVLSFYGSGFACPDCNGWLAAFER